MMLRHFIQVRSFTSSKALLRPKLSAEYKSERLWDKRFNCQLLDSNSDMIRSINSKILRNENLNALETDVFINVAAPRTDEIAQLQEAANLLKKFRKTVYAHMLFPSTSHATCRLFLSSERALSLINLLEDRVSYGIFLDAISQNLLFDTALENENYALASRVAILIMIQEEFGLNDISDKFALYSVAKYIESKTDFKNWSELPKERDPIFTSPEIIAENYEKEKAKAEAESGAGAEAEAEKEEDVDEEEEDAEYIRIPFLRNPYFDDHFDLKNPRSLCGKTFSMIGHHLAEKNQIKLAEKCMVVGSILQGKWADAKRSIESCSRSNTMLGSYSEIMQFYMDNLHGIDAPEDGLDVIIRQGLIQLAGDQPCISEEVERNCSSFSDVEKHDIEQFNTDLVEWSNNRMKAQLAKKDMEDRKRLIEEVKAKKKELMLREQYLYFYDNLQKSNLTRIEYD